MSNSVVHQSSTSSQVDLKKSPMSCVSTLKNSSWELGKQLTYCNIERWKKSSCDELFKRCPAGFRCIYFLLWDILSLTLAISNICCIIYFQQNNFFYSLVTDIRSPTTISNKKSNTRMITFSFYIKDEKTQYLQMINLFEFKLFPLGLLSTVFFVF